MTIVDPWLEDDKDLDDIYKDLINELYQILNTDHIIATNNIVETNQKDTKHLNNLKYCKSKNLRTVNINVRHTITIGTYHEDFRMGYRIIGNNGNNFKTIISTVGCNKVKLELRGHGSKPTDNINDKLKLPMVINILAINYEAFNHAYDMVVILLNQIHNDYTKWLEYNKN